MSTFSLKIFTNSGLLLSEKVQCFTIKTIEGYLTVLREHIPVMSVVDIGTFWLIDKKNEKRYYKTSGGILYISQNITYFLSDECSPTVISKAN